MRSCWQIRQELYEKGGEGKPNGWLVDCTECVMFHSDQSCWEQGSGSPCCCAPVHVTCDFCVLYIEHRREIAELIQANKQSGSTSGTPAHAPSAARLPIPSKGDRSNVMEKLQLNVPDMWADHHVLKVRAILNAMPGVQDVTASSAFRMVTLTFDPAVSSAGAIMGTLDDAGYSIATDGSGVIAESVPVADGKRDPAWTRLGMRQTKTDERDLKTKR
ncbi:MAG: heavy-metal-associated domain-containing protein [Chloroflexi bacterium]|nr:heavy-metal-associated domain-containing protein [Chloroflexota bacterium]